MMSYSACKIEIDQFIPEQNTRWFIGWNIDAKKSLLDMAHLNPLFIPGII